MAEVREIGATHRHDEQIARLRQLADSMESGDTPAPQEIAVLWSTEGGEVLMSTDGDALTLLGMLSAGQAQITMEQGSG